MSDEAEKRRIPRTGQEKGTLPIVRDASVALATSPRLQQNTILKKGIKETRKRRE
jgi:hypothetical protein